MSSNPAPNTIFALLYDYIDTLNYGDDGDYADTLHTLYENTDLEHQRIIINLFANTRVARSPHDTSLTDWEGRTLNPRAICPITLTLTMRALTRRVPLTVTKDRQEKHFTPELLKTLQSEVEAQNQWRNNNPYYCGGGFIPDIQIPEAGEAVARTLTDGLYDLQRDILLVLLVPVEAAPVVINYAHNRDWRADRKILPIEAFPGVVEFWHQQRLYDNCTNIIAAGLGHLSSTTVEKYLTSMGTGGFVSDDYKEWADTLENLFPVREKALEWVMTGNAYFVKSNWEKETLTGKSDSVIAENDNRFNRDYLPITTQQWLLEQRKPTLTYHTDTYTL